MKKSKDSATHLDNALGLALRIVPWFGSALRALIPTPVRDMKEKANGSTLAVTERWHLLYDPAAILEEDLRTLAGGLLHEAFHPLRLHFRRARGAGAERHRWNLATDAEIWDDIEAICQGSSRALMQLPDLVSCKSLGLPGLEGRLAEEIYAVLPVGAGQPVPSKHGGASGSDGVVKEWERGVMEASGDPGRSEAETVRIGTAVAEAVRDHLAGHKAGTIPAGVKAWAEGILAPPKVRWQDHLRGLVRTSAHRVAGAHGLDWSRPSRRQAGVGLGPDVPRIPGWSSPVLRVLVVLDTSGSMGAGEGSPVWSAVQEIEGIIRAATIMASSGGGVMFISADVDPTAPRTVRSAREALAVSVGGGGTDFRPAIELACNLGVRRPHLLVYLTDGEGPAPEEAPGGMDVVWCLVGGHTQPPAPWGKVVLVES